MRKELELIEQIENYLMKRMNASEQIKFEERLANDPVLQHNVNFQKDLMEGVLRMTLLKNAQNARYKFKLFKGIKMALVGVGVTASLTAAYYYVNSADKVESNNNQQQIESQVNVSDEMPDDVKEIEQFIDDQEGFTGEGITKVEIVNNSLFEEADSSNRILNQTWQGTDGQALGGTLENDFIKMPKDDKQSGMANQFLDQEFFEIKTDRDTVVESENGIVLFIPANAFETDDETVDFFLQEALAPEDILYAGLNTMAYDGKELETGGMFYIDAFSKGERVPLRKDIIVDIPTKRETTGMALYDGVKTDNGEFLWQNPQKLTKPLVSTEITELDFYPPGYEDKMEEWGYFEKAFKDSLYYSYTSKIDFSIVKMERSWSIPINSKERRIRLKGFRERMILKRNTDSSQAILNINNYLLYKKKVEKKQRRSVLSKDDLEVEIEKGIERSTQQATILKAIPAWGSKKGKGEPQVEPPSPVAWSVSVEWVEGDLVDLVFDVAQYGGSYIYSTDRILEENPYNMPTQFHFENIGGEYELIGNVREFGIETFESEPNYAIEGLVKYSPTDHVQFKQRVKLNSDKIVIDARYAFMVCEYGVMMEFPREEKVRITISNGEKGVDPSRVKTIWNKEFNNTNLATKAFEERMQWIHQSCDNRILEFYIRNLDMNLSAVDSMIVNFTSNEIQAKFSEFAAEGLGKIEISSDANRRLNAYYEIKRKALRDAILKTNADYWEEQKRLDEEILAQEKLAENRANKNEEVYKDQELAFNIDRIYRELGMKKPDPSVNKAVLFANNSYVNNERAKTTPIKSNRPFFRGSIRNLGWKNVDCLFSIRIRRPSIKTGTVGPAPKVKYTPINVKIESANNYDRVNVYLVPEKFNSYIKIQPENDGYNYRLNEQLDYQIIAIAWRDNQFFYHQSDAKENTYTIALEPISKQEWENRIKGTLSEINAMEEEWDYLDCAQKDQNRKNKNKALRDLKMKAKPYVFPCAEEPQDENLNNNEIVTEETDFLTAKAVMPVNNANIRFSAVISPNGDGYQDYFYIESDQEIENFELHIYSKRGKEVYFSNDVNCKWYGEGPNGKKVRSGEYLCTITGNLVSGHPIEFMQQLIVTYKVANSNVE